MKVFWKDEIIEAEKARVIVGDGAYLEGSGLVETVRVAAGKALNLRLHLKRFAEGARVLMVASPDEGTIWRVAARLIRVNRLRDGALRCRYFRDGSLLMHPLLLPKQSSASKRGIRLLTTPVRHYGPESLQGRLKANSMLPNLLARWESQAWAEDGLRLTEAGFVAEGVWTNIVMEKNGVLFTPPLSQGILEGTTRTAAIESWRKKGGKVIERPLTRYDLYTADRVWVTSSLRGMLKIAEIDGRKIPLL